MTPCEFMAGSVGVSMTWLRPVRVAALLVLSLVCINCGDTYRPVAIPVPPPPPDPSGFHYAIVLSGNAPFNAGSSTRIDVSGDTNVSVLKMGLGPVHAALLPNASLLYVANSLEDTVSGFSPLGTTIATISLPSLSKPSFVATAQNDTVYVANPGDGVSNGTVVSLSTVSNVITQTMNVGVNPIAMAETPDARKLYVANQGSDSVTGINVLDKTVSATVTDASIGSPVWVAARSDSSRVFVLSSGTGTVSAINTFSDTIMPGTVSVGAGANFMVYDKNLGRLYVTNPVAASLTVIDASLDVLSVLSTITFAAGSAACPAGCVPTTVAALPDGSRVYVASYQLSGACTEPLDAPPCITSQVTVISTSNNNVTKTVAITLDDPLAVLPGSKPDTPELTQCDSARFRLYAAASADNTRLYVAYCDAGSTAIIRTIANTDPIDPQPEDTLVLNLPSPASSYPPPAPGAQPPPQNPVFALTSP